jgi:hypothetical protein
VLTKHVRLAAVSKGHTGHERRCDLLCLRLRAWRHMSSQEEQLVWLAAQRFGRDEELSGSWLRVVITRRGHRTRRDDLEPGNLADVCQIARRKELVQQEVLCLGLQGSGQLRSPLTPSH